MPDLAIENGVLRRENEALRDRVTRLERCLFGPDVPYALLGLPNVEQRILAALMKRTVLTKDQLFEVVYSDRHEADQPAEAQVIESHISKLRKRLRAFGVEVTSQRFVGYAIPPASKAIVRDLVSRANVDLPSEARAA